jgi:hypothetical protein
MDDDVLRQVVALVQNAPHSTASLTLYALVSTLKMEGSGHLFMLRKLRELDAGQRRLAYGLMELMARQGNHGSEWDAAVRDMDRALRGV